jgi:RimJ/RimL family protein N-acetyltransferase
MKYHAKILNKYNEMFSVESVEEYTTSEKDIEDFTLVLQDEAVRKYITDEFMAKYNFQSVDKLAKDILDLCPKRLAEREELRFIIRNSSNQIVGMIGIDILEKGKGELWYFKISTSKSFMYEIAEKVLEFLKKEQIQYLITSVKPDNFRSRNILEKLGFKPTPNENEMELSV